VLSVVMRTGPMTGCLTYCEDKGRQVIDQFDSALWKVDRARKHADDLETEVHAFWETNPFEVEMVGTPLTGPGFFRVNRMAAVPENIPLIAGDAAHNIRSALDHFAWSAVPPHQRRRRTCFPIWSSAAAPAPAKWREQVSRQLQGATAELIEAVVELEAWDTGRDSLLWVINELDRIDKHRLLLSVAVAFTGIGLDGDSYELTVAKKYSGVDAVRPLVIAPREWTPLEEGKILFTSPHDVGLSAAKATLNFDMTLEEPARVTDKSAVHWLRILAGLAEKVVRDLAPLA
jgi:hypothetical protein